MKNEPLWYWIIYTDTPDPVNPGKEVMFGDCHTTKEAAIKAMLRVKKDIQTAHQIIKEELYAFGM